MKTSRLIPIDPQETFRFACNRHVPCFNHCCRDLNQALTPYDVLRLKNHLNITTKSFIHTYTTLHTGTATGLPVASLRFTGNEGKNCPFVTPDGCRVYAARPSSCRAYPLARALRRTRSDGCISEHFAIIQEPHCKGFEQPGPRMSVAQWILDQELDAYNEMNDMLMDLIALKNQVRPGELSPEHRQMVQTAFYDVEALTQKALARELQGMDRNHLKPLPNEGDDESWLIWGLEWVKQTLFGERSR